jgi:hypothetical protein
MLDVSRALAAVSDALQGSSPTQASLANKIPAMLSDAGPDAATPVGVAPDEIVRLIAEHGVGGHPLTVAALQLLSRQHPAAS